jgi:hypothetical protein
VLGCKTIIWELSFGFSNQYALGRTASALGRKNNASIFPLNVESESRCISLLYCVWLNANSFVYESAQM